MQLSQIMSKPVFSIPPDADLDVAREMMTEHHVHHLVVAQGAHILGVVSNHDLQRRRALYDDRWLVEDVMTEPAITGSPDMTAAEAAKLIRGRRRSCAFAAARGLSRRLHDYVFVKRLLLLTVAGCTTVKAEPSPEQRFEEDMMVRFHMHENYGLARTLERYLLVGKLDSAKDLARGLAQAPDEPGFSAWAKQSAVVRDRASRLAEAKTLDEAVRHEASLLAACAGCHVDANARPEFLKWAPAPPDRPGVEARMQRHLWASDRLWEGMVGDADASWQAGLDILGAPPLPDLDAKQKPFAQKLQRFADDGRKRTKAFDLAARTQVYGDILGACVGCHATRPHP